MCLSKARFSEETTGEPIMEDIAKIRVEGNRVILSSLFGEEKTVEANIEEIDFTRSRIILGRN